MKKIRTGKKVISILCVCAILMSIRVNLAFAETEFSENFNSVTISENGSPVIAEDTGLATGAWQNKDRFALGDGILGKTAGDKSLKLNTYCQAYGQPYLLKRIDGEADLSKDFYVTTQVYVPELAAGTSVRLGGEYYDGSTRVLETCLFMSMDEFTKVKPNADPSSVNYYGWYTSNNWHTVVFAYSADLRKASWYMDGELFGTKNVTSSIKNLVWGVRFENHNSAALNLLYPNWVVVDDYAVVNDTYDSNLSDTAITSNNADIVVKASKPAIKRISSGSERAKLGASVSVKDGTKVSDLEAALTASYGKNLYVVKIGEIIDKEDWSLSADNRDALKTVIPSGDEYVSPDMKVVVVAGDDTITLYNITVTSNGETLLSLVSGSGYSLSGTTISNVPKDTTVASFKSNFAAAGELKMYSGAGYELKDATILSEGVTLRAYSSSGNYSQDYAVNLSGITSNEISLAAPAAGMAAYRDGTVLSEYENGALTKGSNVLPGFAGRSGGDFGTNTYTKVSRNGGIGYLAESSYVYKAGRSPLYWVQGLAANTKEYIVTEFTFEPVTNGRYMIYNKAIVNNASKLLADIMTYNNSLLFKDGKIYIGGQPANEMNVREIGSYENGNAYKVQYVVKQPQEGDKLIYIEGIYLNGEKIFPIAGTAAVSAMRNGWYDEETGYYVLALIPGISGSSNPNMITKNNYNQYVTNTISRFENVYFGACATSEAEKAKAYYTDILVYGTDKFPVESKSEEVKLILTSDIYDIFENDAIEGTATIKGYSGTAADVLSKLDSDISTTVCMFYKDGVTEVNPNVTARAGMIVKVMNLAGTKSKTYVLSDKFDPGTDENVFDADTGTFYAAKTVRKYTTDEEKFLYVAACYDANGKLTAIELDDKISSAIGELSFNLELNCRTGLSDGSVVKVMLLNGTSFKPYTSAYIYDEINGETYSGELPVSNY